MRRVNEAVKEVLSEGIGELKDPRIGFVTATGVETSPDLRHARVFVSVLGSQRKRERSLSGLTAAHGVLQARVAREAREAERLLDEAERYLNGQEWELGPRTRELVTLDE